MAVFNDIPGERDYVHSVLHPGAQAAFARAVDAPTADALLKALAAAIDTDAELEAARAEMAAAERIWRSRESDRDVMWAEYTALLQAYRAAHP
jgi:hypothetical protein